MSDLTQQVIGGALGLAVLFLLAVLCGRANDRSRCSGDCRQGRECDCE